ncbi:rab guanine nucleotide exchange factor S2 [Purpureocillium takamizusanense]|uniref:Rab guanine nucleotide exchange factor S2 n=1 Tax=Purpureocillium takamizusanense TaxID=2060973 RepID=A0A9Q8QLZ5_9HYPO|nr:rab guanine nucleotide exchange factor S2 [Purpureocillium takamizusanense]UNI22165.1 rab guanine nucleotide exchange factor S2 [Purpureocillium takamizusanense]
MESFIHVAGWSQHHQSSPRPSSGRSFGHLRSLSSVAHTTSVSSPPSPGPPKSSPFPKSSSTSQLPGVSLKASLSAPILGSDELSTLPDPRRRVSDLDGDNGRSHSTHHPDLTDEVATLSTKLINAINHQTILDDTLSATRHELQSARDRIRELERRNQSQRDMMAGDVWVRKSSLDHERKAMQTDKKLVLARLAEETAKRLDVEKEKKRIEQELENLTTALFEEANKMVIGAKEEAQAQHEALQRKNDQLKAQLADSESLLKSQQEQLSELKQVLENLATERDDLTTGTTAPPSPGVPRFDAVEVAAAALPPGSAESTAPCPPLGLQHLLQPVLRVDLGAFDDFMTLAHLSQQRRGSRISSGSMGGLASSTFGLGGGGGGATFSSHPNASTASLSTATASSSAPQSPNTPASTASMGSIGQGGAPIPNLKDTKFYKRVLSEDIEPTLRLDTAPGLSWLARRSVLAAIADGSLVVEPVPQVATTYVAARPQYYPCSLCGEARKSEEHLRTHRFRTSEAESAQRYPLCNYCLTRVRSTCDFVGFLRMVRDGYWKMDDQDHERAAWEECVKLREHMFWARIGGGVVPAITHAGVPTAAGGSNPHDMAATTDKEPRLSQERAAGTGLSDGRAAIPEQDETLRDADAAAAHGAEPREPQTPPEQTTDSNASDDAKKPTHAPDESTSDEPQQSATKLATN